MDKKGKNKILAKEDKYQHFIDEGYPIAILRTYKNIDDSYSICVEMFNCLKRDKQLVKTAINMCSIKKVGEHFEKS